VAALVASIPLPDFNHDGVVDAADYVVWRKNSDPAADYNLRRTHFGKARPPVARLKARPCLSRVRWHYSSLPLSVVSQLAAANWSTTSTERRRVESTSDMSGFGCGLTSRYAAIVPRLPEGLAMPPNRGRSGLLRHMLIVWALVSLTCLRSCCLCT
jgi:hypothetical protein